MIKISAETWINTARNTLIEEGIGGVKIDRLANRLGVTRGGFYHNFKDREELLDHLIAHWEQTCRFLPQGVPSSQPAKAVEWFDDLIARHIEGDGYDYRFDLAVREWARSDQRAAWAVERSDRERLQTLTRFFEILGYDSADAPVRARIFYYHQIGYYAIGVKESAAERRRALHTYVDLLCGSDVIDAARNEPARVRKERASG
jgi:AcrR family transcriptional regulator